MYEGTQRLVWLLLALLVVTSVLGAFNSSAYIGLDMAGNVLVNPPPGQHVGTCSHGTEGDRAWV